MWGSLSPVQSTHRNLNKKNLSHHGASYICVCLYIYIYTHLMYVSLSLSLSIYRKRYYYTTILLLLLLLIYFYVDTHTHIWRVFVHRDDRQVQSNIYWILTWIWFRKCVFIQQISGKWRKRTETIITQWQRKPCSCWHVALLEVWSDHYKNHCGENILFLLAVSVSLTVDCWTLFPCSFVPPPLWPKAVHSTTPIAHWDVTVMVSSNETKHCV